MKILVEGIQLEGDIEISSGRNIEIKRLGQKIIVDAPSLNKQRVKCAEFDLIGDQIEIRAGKGIRLSSINPNVLIISSHYSELEAQYIDLQRRFENLEKLFLNTLHKN